jgi:hypothetical protein
MNNTQIKNGEIRIFPYYKGEYWGKSEVEFGFSNKSSALKYMKEIPEEDIYESMGGYEKYYNENAYLLRPDNKRLYVFNPKSISDKRREYGCYDYDFNSELVYLKDLDNKESIEKDIKELGFIPDANRSKFREFEEKYALFPRIYVDEKPYISAKKKYIQNNVDFKQGIVKISVEFVEDNIDDN